VDTSFRLFTGADGMDAPLTGARSRIPQTWLQAWSGIEDPSAGDMTGSAAAMESF